MFRAAEQDQEKIQKARIEFRNVIEQIPCEDLIFIDEAGVNIAMAQYYAWAYSHQRIYAPKPAKRPENVTMLAALSTQGVLACMNIPGYTDTQVFVAFLKDVLLPVLPKGKYIVLDNLSAHKSPLVQEIIELAGSSLLYLPSYSPDFSPVELCWSKVKHILRSRSARTSTKLNSSISFAFSQVSASDALSWFLHCGYCPISN